jgi:hypothetical protein
MAASQYQMQRTIAMEAAEFAYVKWLDDVFADPRFGGSIEAAYRSLQPDAPLKLEYERYRAAAAKRLRPIMSNWKVESIVALRRNRKDGDFLIGSFRSFTNFVNQLKSNDASDPNLKDLMQTLPSEEGVDIANIGTSVQAYTMKEFGKKYEEWRRDKLSLIDALVSANRIAGEWTEF